MLSVTSKMLRADLEGSRRAIRSVTSALIVPYAKHWKWLHFRFICYFKINTGTATISNCRIPKHLSVFPNPSLLPQPSSTNHHLLRITAASISDIYIVEIIKYYGWSGDFNTQNQLDSEYDLRIDKYIC